jgi:hypothetical protein
LLLFSRKRKRYGANGDIDIVENDDATVTNSVYLDDTSLSMYHKRTGVVPPKGNLIRIRYEKKDINMIETKGTTNVRR